MSDSFIVIVNEKSLSNIDKQHNIILKYKSIIMIFYILQIIIIKCYTIILFFFLLFFFNHKIQIISSLL